MAADASRNPAPKPAKTPEARYLEGRGCLQQADTDCAQLALAGLNPASPYAKLLEAQIALAAQDDDTALRLLLPLQSEEKLLPEARTSLHASLAEAYEKHDNPLRALQQYCLAAATAAPDEAEPLQNQTWALLKAQPRASLLEMRGESPDTVAQGWIDLALAASGSAPAAEAIAQWQAAYPGHPAPAELWEEISGTPAAVPVIAPAIGKVALLLPLDNPAYAKVAEAIRAGFLAAQSQSPEKTEVVVYPTAASAEGAVAAYAKALEAGAVAIAGPLTREEVAAVAASEWVRVPTLAFYELEAHAASAKLLLFGRPVEAEAQQVAAIGRQLGMQSALVVAADAPLAKRMAQAFSVAWKEAGGSLALQADFSATTPLTELKTFAAAHPADMIFLAANVEAARWARPALNPATPTFATSHVYDGDAQHPLNGVLNAVQFVDMPWLLDRANAAFAPYRQASLKFLEGESQRWYAMGVDAWRLVSSAVAHPGAPLRGLSGDIHWVDNRAVRVQSLGQFRNGSVALEPLP